MTGYNFWSKNIILLTERLISIESQPKKIFVRVVVVIGVVVIVVHVVVAVIPVVETRNIPLNLGWNQVINTWDVINAVVVVVVVVVIVVVIVVVADSRNLLLMLG